MIISIEFSTRIKALSFSKRIKFMPFLFLEILKIALLCSVVPILIMVVAIVLDIGFNIKLPTLFIIFVMMVVAVILTLLKALKELPSEQLIKILGNIEKRG